MSFRLLSVSLLCCLCARSAAATSTFELNGTVMDESGAGLMRARLTLIHHETTLVRATTTNAAKRYDFPGLAPGSYSLEVTAADFATSRYAANIMLQAVYNWSRTRTTGTTTLFSTRFLSIRRVRVSNGTKETGSVVLALT